MCREKYLRKEYGPLRRNTLAVSDRFDTTSEEFYFPEKNLTTTDDCEYKESRCVTDYPWQDVSYFQSSVVVYYNFPLFMVEIVVD